jgi:hypothetical protein
MAEQQPLEMEPRAFIDPEWQNPDHTDHVRLNDVLYYLMEDPVATGEMIAPFESATEIAHPKNEHMQAANDAAGLALVSLVFRKGIDERIRYDNASRDAITEHFRGTEAATDTVMPEDEKRLARIKLFAERRGAWRKQLDLERADAPPSTVEGIVESTAREIGPAQPPAEAD